MITYGFSTIGCPGLDLESALDLCTKYELDFIELRSLGGTTDILEYFKKNEAPCDTSKVRVLASSFAIFGEDDKSREKLCHEAELADKIGARYIRIFGAGGSNAKNTLSSEQILMAANTIDRLRGEFIKRNISCELILETHDVFSFSKTCFELNKCLASPISILWDSYHTWRYGQETPEETWNLIGPVIRHIHYKDGSPIPDSMENHYAIPGEGQYPTSMLKTALMEKQYVGGVSLEWEKLWHPELCPVEDVIPTFLRVFS